MPGHPLQPSKCLGLLSLQRHLHTTLAPPSFQVGMYTARAAQLPAVLAAHLRLVPPFSKSLLSLCFSSIPILMVCHCTSSNFHKINESAKVQTIDGEVAPRRSKLPRKAPRH